MHEKLDEQLGVPMMLCFVPKTRWGRAAATGSM